MKSNEKQKRERQINVPVFILCIVLCWCERMFFVAVSKRCERMFFGRCAKKARKDAIHSAFDAENS